MERGQLADIRPLFWQSDTSVARNSWCYTVEQDYRSSASILHDLIDIVSKNGTLLLNIGPRADGTIPEGDEQILLDIGRWLAINGEAIYGSRPWKVYGEGPTEVIEGGFTDSKRAEFTAEDVRFTTKEGALYVIMLGHPQTSELEIRSLGLNAHPVDIRRISLIGTNQPVEWTQRDDALVVHLPALPDNQPAFTLKIDGDQSPEWRGTP